MITPSNDDLPVLDPARHCAVCGLEGGTKFTMLDPAQPKIPRRYFDHPEHLPYAHAKCFKWVHSSWEQDMQYAERHGL